MKTAINKGMRGGNATGNVSEFGEAVCTVFSTMQNVKSNTAIMQKSKWKSVMKFVSLFILFAFTFQISFSQVPAWSWARSGAGNGSVDGTSVATDPFGNIYVTGYYSSDNVTFGSVTLQNEGLSFADVYLVKYDPSGNVLWVQRFGGSSNDRGMAVTTDKAGNVYLTGYFYSPTIVFGKDTLSNAGVVGDIFVVKFDGLGNVLWAKREGAAALEIPYAIHVDDNDNIIVAGRFSSLSITFGTTTLKQAGSMDAFIVKYNSSGEIMWANGAGGGTNDEAYALSSDAQGNIYMAGYFSQPANFGSIKLTAAGQSDLFLAKYDPAGTILWAKRAGGKGDDRANSLKTDAAGNSYITGYFTNDSISFGSIIIPNEVGENTFFAKYDTDGNVLWARGLGADSQAFGIALYNENVYVCGSFNADTLTYGTSNIIINGNSDFFLLNCDTDGKPNWAIKQTSDGKSSETAHSVSTDNLGNVIITGLFSSEPLTFGTSGISSVRSFDMFVAKLGGVATGIEELSDAGEFNIFPNPGNGFFTIKTDGSINSVDVYSISGVKVFSRNDLNKQMSQEINLSTLPQGIYLMKANVSGKQYSRKIIIQNSK